MYKIIDMHFRESAEFFTSPIHTRFHIDETASSLDAESLNKAKQALIKLGKHFVSKDTTGSSDDKPLDIYVNKRTELMDLAYKMDTTKLSIENITTIPSRKDMYFFHIASLGESTEVVIPRIAQKKDIKSYGIITSETWRPKNEDGYIVLICIPIDELYAYKDIRKSTQHLFETREGRKQFWIEYYVEILRKTRLVTDREIVLRLPDEDTEEDHEDLRRSIAEFGHVNVKFMEKDYSFEDRANEIHSVIVQNREAWLLYMVCLGLPVYAFTYKKHINAGRFIIGSFKNIEKPWPFSNKDRDDYFEYMSFRIFTLSEIEGKFVQHEVFKTLKKLRALEKIMIEAIKYSVKPGAEEIIEMRRWLTNYIGVEPRDIKSFHLRDKFTFLEWLLNVFDRLGNSPLARGRAQWNMLHMVSIQLVPSEHTKMFHFLNGVFYNLLCGVCKPLFSKLMGELKPEKEMDFYKWTWATHNRVNVKLHCKTWDNLEESREYYKTYLRNIDEWGLYE